MKQHDLRVKKQTVKIYSPLMLNRQKQQFILYIQCVIMLYSSKEQNQLNILFPNHT